jgi:RNase H-fold protein (predicted Holliday junction resolvase)
MSTDRLRVTPLIAPALLVAVALVQLHVSRTTWLTPWKGGGFGMFSTVDSPGARFLRIVLETDTGYVRVGVPARLQRDAARLREAPNETALRALAEKLAAAIWVPDERTSPEAAYGALLAAASSRDGRVPPQSGGPVRGATAYRILDEGESPHEAPLRLRAVQVEIRRYRLDASTARLVSDRILEARSATR